MNEIMLSRGFLHDRPWKTSLINTDEISTSIPQGQSGNMSSVDMQFDTGARCIPDAFPCAVYLNGTFYGVYAWAIKKHRDNMHQNKKEAKQIQLDGNINPDTLLNTSSIDWTKFEIRNPKSLVTTDGNKYDGDNPKELSDSDAFSSTVKSYIVALSNAIPQILTANTTYQRSGSDTDLAALKRQFETFFDPDNVIDYTIFSQITLNYDGFDKNWQWCTWDGVKWYILAYDLDGIFGAFWRGDRINPPQATNINSNSSLPSYYVINYYKSQLQERYAALRKNKIIDADHITELLNQWCTRIGTDYYEREFKKWPLGQTFSNGSELLQTGVAGDSIYRVNKWITESIEKADALYQYTP